jgi:signal transduction histidine kinase
MPIVESEFAPRSDPRLAARLAEAATSRWPVWLWSSDGSRILWANAVGTAIFGATPRRFDSKSAVGAQIIRLAATLPSAGPSRLERLRGLGVGFGRALTCACSRVVNADGTAAVLVVATEAAGQALPLAERLRRLFPGPARPVAAFAADGAMVFANHAALERVGGPITLAALGIEATAREALAAGRASGATPYGPVTITRVGSDASTALAVTFDAPPQEIPAPETVPEAPAPAMTCPSGPTPDGAIEEAAIGATSAPRAGAASAVAVAPAAAPAPEPVPPAPANDEPAAERRHPLRFVWQMDADGRFVLGSDEFIELMGPRVTAAFGRMWSEVAAELKIDPEQQIAGAVATRETWSGVVVSWPVDELRERLPVELSGLPVFDRERNFRGYRGFGVCRDIARARPLGFVAPVEAPAAESAAAAAASTAPAPAASAVESVARGEPVEVPKAAPAANVVPFRSGTAIEPKAPGLSPVEHKAFRELAEELTARLWGGGNASPTADDGAGVAPAQEPDAAVVPASSPATAASAAAASAAAAEEAKSAAGKATAEAAAIEEPAAIEAALLDRLPLGVLIYRSDALLYGSRHFLELSGYENLDALATAGGLQVLFAEPSAGVVNESGGAQQLSIVTSAGDRVPVEGRLFAVPWSGGSALALVLTSNEAEKRQRASVLALDAAEQRIRELKASIEPFKQIEDELRVARREMQRAAAAKGEFLAKVSHEIRTPLNANTGLAEVVMAERSGPIANERYRECLKDILGAGTHLVSLLNDLLDLSKIETGQLNLSFADISLNDLTQQCVGIMQPQASRARIIIRTSLTPGMPRIVADERSLRQIVLNLLSNSIKFTGPGGQVIVSTAFADNGEAVLRVRDTGAGTNEKHIEAALEPFREVATSGSWGSGGTGLGLPSTKALAEANRAHFSIKSAPNAGTLIEVAFPPGRVDIH